MTKQELDRSGELLEPACKMESGRPDITKHHVLSAPRKAQQVKVAKYC